MKKIISIISVLLILALCLSLGACGEKSDSKTKDSAEEQVTEAPTEAPGYEIGKSYHWDDIDFELTKVTDDLSDYDDINKNMIGEAKGKFIVVEFTITEGKIPFNTVNDKLKDGAVKLSDTEYSTCICKGLDLDGQSIGSNTEANVTGSIIVFFDAPEDYSLDDAVLTVEEN